MPPHEAHASESAHMPAYMHFLQSQGCWEASSPSWAVQQHSVLHELANRHNMDVNKISGMLSQQ